MLVVLPYREAKNTSPQPTIELTWINSHPRGDPYRGEINFIGECTAREGHP